MVPSLASVWAVSIRIVVDLPAPLGPSSPKQTPGGTTRSRPSTAVIWPKRLTTPRSSIDALSSCTTLRVAAPAGGPARFSATGPRARRRRWRTRSRRVRRHPTRAGAAAGHLEYLGELRRDHDVARELDPALEVGGHRVRVAADQPQELDAVHGDGQLGVGALDAAVGARRAVVDLQQVGVDALVGAAGDVPADRRLHVGGGLGVQLARHLPEDPVQQGAAGRRLHDLVQALGRRIAHEAADAVGDLGRRVGGELLELVQRALGVKPEVHVATGRY